MKLPECLRPTLFGLRCLGLRRRSRVVIPDDATYPVRDHLHDSGEVMIGRAANPTWLAFGWHTIEVPGHAERFNVSLARRLLTASNDRQFVQA